jgi:SAM domain (Sterile alpha motif)
VDVALWLRGLGLERYEPAFRENEIDWEVLPELTEGDLEELGLPLGPRKKLIKAIAGLSGNPTTVSTEAEPSPRPVSPEAERRRAKSITDLAEQEGVADAYVCRLLPLTRLAPDIVEAILDGRQPKGLRLAEMLRNGPLSWEDQRRGFGFPVST